jgi:SAM-dependent methyltransferase
VVGIDPSAAMIEAARTRANEAGVAPVFRQVSGECFRAEEEFDAVICLFTTLGQISEEGENRSLVPQMYANLRGGGYFVVEVPQRAWTVRHLTQSERFGEGEQHTNVTRRFDSEKKLVTELFEVVSPESTRGFLLRYRLYNRAELTELLESAGFTVQASFGDYDGNPLGPDSAMMLLFARKANN